MKIEIKIDNSMTLENIKEISKFFSNLLNTDFDIEIENRIKELKLILNNR